MTRKNALVRRTVDGRDMDVVVLTNAGAVAEIWPALGGNCVRWATPVSGEILWSPSIEELAARPTRGGIPVLFPFPNRIRGGRFQFLGQTYALPCNDNSQRNAIHGFSPRVAWRVLSASTDSAKLSFRISQDAPESMAHWPGDGELTLTWQLKPTTLSCHAEVRNFSKSELPFGLGFHPYFCVSEADDAVQVHAQSRWELQDCLPTGKKLTLDDDSDLRQPRRVGGLKLDDVYADLDIPSDGKTLGLVSRLIRRDGNVINIRTTRDFRELVVFTPPHGMAVCLEPYTCVTDAVNLQAKQIDAGWKVLNSNESWFGTVEYELGRG